MKINITSEEAEQIYKEQDGWERIQTIERDDNRESFWDTSIFYNKTEKRYAKVRYEDNTYGESYEGRYVRPQILFRQGWVDE